MLTNFISELRAAWLTAGLECDPLPTGQQIFGCPASDSPLIVMSGGVECCDCGWRASGEPWEIARAAAAAKRKSDQPTEKSEADPLAALMAELERRKFDPLNPPPKETVIFRINGTPISHAGNISTIEAHPKGGKSGFVCASIASTFARPGADCLGWESSNPQGHAVIHFDTEQSPGDHHNMMLRAMRIARVYAPPDWLLSYSITGMTVRDMRTVIGARVESAAREFGGVHSIHLDGVADVLHDVNDAAESFEFIAWLVGLCIKYKCSCFNVLHLNPGDSGKSRGHLGSHLTRKSEHVLRITKTDGASVVTSQWSRRAEIPEESRPCFAWGVTEGHHVTVDNPGGSDVKQKTGGRKKSYDNSIILAIMGKKVVTPAEVCAAVMASGWTKRTFQREWVDLITRGVIIESRAAAGQYMAK